MAFKMNKPIIKGSALHKEAVAKLQRLDHSSLITAAQALGQSTTPGAVDFSVDRKIDMSSYEKPKKKKKKKKEEKEEETVIEEKTVVEPTEKIERRGAEETEVKLEEQIIQAKEYKKPEKKFRAGYEMGTVQVSGVGDRQIANYNKEQQKRLQTEGVFNEEAGRVVLPEEIIDGKFVGLKAENIHIVETGKKQQKIFQPRIRESQKTDITIKGKQVSKGRLRILDKLWAKSGPSVRENLRSEGYIPAEERNNAQASR
jgi:hypothetical protein